MHSKFQIQGLSLTSWNIPDYPKYIASGNAILSKIKEKMNIDSSLVKTPRGNIDAIQTQQNWFSCSEPFDIFISHSHDDKNLAIALAGWLYESFRLRCFVDSELWECCYEKIPQIKCECREKNIETTQISSGVYIMLQMALIQMMDQSESVFFLNTNNSLKKFPFTSTTFSPWIYSEISATRFLRQTKHKIKIEQPKSPLTTFSNESHSPFLEFKMDVSDFPIITWNKLRDWKNLTKTFSKDPLGELYNLINPHHLTT